VAAGDINGDGQVDLVSSSRDDDKIAWYENDGAAEPTFTETVISTNVVNAWDVYIADLDGDQNLDIIAAANVAPEPPVEPPEGEEVGGGGPAPEVDGLIVVADDGEVGHIPRQQLQHLQLCVVRVLELVDQDPAVALAQPGEDRRPLAEQAEGPVDLITEIHEARLGQEPLVGRVERGQLDVPLRLVALFVAGGRRQTAFGPGEVVLGRDVLVLGTTDEGAQGPEVARRVAEGPEPPEGQIEDPLAEEDDLLRLGQHAELGVETDLQSRVAQHPVAKGVERGDLGLGVPVRDELIHPLRHLRRRLLGEGEGEDLFGPRALGGDQVGDATSEDRRLPGARPGNDEERTLAVGHRLELGLVQPLEDARLSSGGSGAHEPSLPRGDAGAGHPQAGAGHEALARAATATMRACESGPPWGSSSPS